MTKQGFDIRIVSYEHIHSVTNEDMDAFVKAINPKPNDKILDAFCGYGAIGKKCLEKEPKIDLWLNDESTVQIKRAKENLSSISKNHFLIVEFEKMPFKNDFFDKIAIKMGLHEVSKERQLIVAKKIFNLLKSQGKLILWDIMLDNDSQNTFQDIIRKKDELAGFNMLMNERYFFREEEFISTMKEAGFTKIKPVHIITSKFSSRKRLESELHNDSKLLKSLNDYIRKVFPESLKKKLRYEDHGEDINFMIPKKIYVMEK